MQRLLIGMMAAAVAWVPAWALASNQEIAEQIAARLRDSGQLQGYRIAVKFQDGTAWLRGQIASREQMEAAVRIVSETPGVTRVENGLTIGSAAPSPAPQAGRQSSATATERPLQQALGAFAPDQLSRWASPRSAVRQVGGEATQPVSQLPAGASMGSVGIAERVSASFATAPVQQATATSLMLAPASAAQPVPAPPSAPLPSVPAAPSAGPAQSAPAPGGASPIPTILTPPSGPPAQARPTAPAPASTPGAPLPMGQPYPMPQYGMPMATGPAARYDQPTLPAYAWPTYAAYPNYAAVTYPKKHSPTAWPYIGPFYPYPQVPLGWRKVTLEWHDGWWNLDFEDGARSGPFSGLFRPWR